MTFPGQSTPRGGSFLRIRCRGKSPSTKNKTGNRVENQNDKLTTGPITGLIMDLAVPATVGIVFHTLYNITDTYFGGLLGSQALAALSLSFPVFFIIISFGSGLQTGTTALIGNSLGSGERETAKTFACQGVSFSVLLSAVLTLAGLLAAPALFRILGARGDYLVMSMDYIRPIIIGIVFFSLNYSFNAVLVATGDTKSFRNILIAGAFLNAALDPWFLFGGLGLPALGIAGVGWATTLIQALASVYLGRRALRTGLISFRKLSDFRPKVGFYLDIARQGIPASLNMMTVAVGIFVITYFLSIFGQDAVAAYGTATRIEQFFLMPFAGLNTATLTLVAQNNGAGLPDRVREVVRKTLTFGIAILGMGGLILFFLCRILMSLFTDNPEVVALGYDYLRVASITLPSYVILYINVSALQGLKRPLFALWMGLFRQIAAPVVAFYLLAFGLGLKEWGVWWGIFAVTWTAALITLFYVRRILKGLNTETGG